MDIPSIGVSNIFKNVTRLVRPEKPANPDKAKQDLRVAIDNLLKVIVPDKADRAAFTGQDDEFAGLGGFVEYYGFDRLVRKVIGRRGYVTNPDRVKNLLDLLDQHAKRLPPLWQRKLASLDNTIRSASHISDIVLASSWSFSMREDFDKKIEKFIIFFNNRMPQEGGQIDPHKVIEFLEGNPQAKQELELSAIDLDFDYSNLLVTNSPTIKASLEAFHKWWVKYFYDNKITREDFYAQELVNYITIVTSEQNAAYFSEHFDNQLASIYREFEEHYYDDSPQKSETSEAVEARCKENLSQQIYNKVNAFSVYLSGIGEFIRESYPTADLNQEEGRHIDNLLRLLQILQDVAGKLSIFEGYTDIEDYFIYIQKLSYLLNSVIEVAADLELIYDGFTELAENDGSIHNGNFEIKDLGGIVNVLGEFFFARLGGLLENEGVHKVIIGSNLFDQVFEIVYSLNEADAVRMFIEGTHSQTVPDQILDQLREEASKEMAELRRTNRTGLRDIHKFIAKTAA